MFMVEEGAQGAPGMVGTEGQGGQGPSTGRLYSPALFGLGLSCIAPGLWQRPRFACP